MSLLVRSVHCAMKVTVPPSYRISHGVAHANVSTHAALLLPLSDSCLTKCRFELIGFAVVGHPLSDIAERKAPLSTDTHRGDVAIAG